MVAVMLIAALSRTPIRNSTDSHPQRRHILFGMVATLASIATGNGAVARESDIPDFRSGRFQFTILQPRQILPSIRLFQLDGKTTGLSSLRGQPTLLNFWAMWCPACRTELPILDRLQEQHRHTGLRLIAVSEDRGERATVERFVNSLSIRNLAIYLDPNGYVAFSDTDNIRNAPFALYGMPITYAIAASGWIVGYMSGAADWTSSVASDLIEFLHRS